MTARTAVFFDELCTYHQMGYLHPESPKRLQSIAEVLDGDGVGMELHRLAARDATTEEIERIHDASYVQRIASTAGGELVALDPDTSANAYTWDAARRAAGGFLACVDAVQKGDAQHAFAFVRPPGHHAEPGHAMGFCIFNNIAIAAARLKEELGVERIAIIDYDLHHGNGTQHVFYQDPQVFYASVHRMPFFPGTGRADEIGEGPGRGLTLNVPLDVGCGDDDFRRAIDDEIVPAVERFAPQILLLSAGYDAHVRDPLGGMRMTTEGYAKIMQSMVDLARATCDGKMAAVLEGGYDLKALRDSVEVSLEEMVRG